MYFQAEKSGRAAGVMVNKAVVSMKEEGKKRKARGMYSVYNVSLTRHRYCSRQKFGEGTYM